MGDGDVGAFRALFCRIVVLEMRGTEKEFCTFRTNVPDVVSHQRPQRPRTHNQLQRLNMLDVRAHARRDRLHAFSVPSPSNPGIASSTIFFRFRRNRLRDRPISGV